MRRARDPYRENGFAIVIVLWIVMILSALTMTFATRARMDMKMLKFQQDTARADGIARAGLRQAMVLLREDALKDYDIDIRETIVDFDDKDRFPYDGGNEAWAYNPDLYDDVEFGGGTFTVTVRDESGKLPVNNGNMTQEVIAALLTQIGVDDEDDALTLAGAIVDWRDGDEAPSEGGGDDRKMGEHDTETLFYNADLRDRDLESEVPEYVPKNKPFSSLEELMLVWGITPSLYFGEDVNRNFDLDRNENDGDRSWPPDDKNGELALGLKNYMTTYSNALNLNTASPEIYYALLYPQYGDDAVRMARDLDRYRNGSDGDQYTDDDQMMRTANDSDGDSMHFDRAGRVELPVLDSMLKKGGVVASNVFEVTVLAEYKDVQRGLRAVVARAFIEEERLPLFGEDTNDPLDMEQVDLTILEYETLRDAQDRYFGQSSKKRRGRGRRRR